MLAAGFLCAASRAGSLGLVQLSEGNRAFACALFKEIAPAGENVFFSPFSISAAMAMTYAGAREETASQMQSTLRFPVSHDGIAPVFGEMHEALTRGQGEGVEFRIANSLWPHKDYTFKESYLTLIEQYFHSEIFQLDYNEPEAARQRINVWVEDTTNEKIKDLIPEGALNSMTRMVLANAVYFNGNWTHAFKPEATSEQPFYADDGSEKKTMMMTGKLKAGYGEVPGAQVLSMSYEGNAYSMMMVLPEKDRRVGDLEAELSAETLAAWQGAIIRHHEVDITIPKFKLTSEFSLSKALMAMGMTDAFSGTRANFSGMDGNTGSIFISDILHKAFVDVHEEGTEAAAATAVIIRATSFRPPDEVPVFRADRPFLFFITEQTTGSILFLGRYASPPQG